jgi:signal transduction histidine kinase
MLHSFSIAIQEVSASSPVVLALQCAATRTATLDVTESDRRPEWATATVRRAARLLLGTAYLVEVLTRLNPVSARVEQRHSQGQLIGLACMRERAESLGGDFLIESTLGTAGGAGAQRTDVLLLGRELGLESAQALLRLAQGALA